MDGVCAQDSAHLLVSSESGSLNCLSSHGSFLHAPFPFLSQLGLFLTRGEPAACLQLLLLLLAAIMNIVLMQPCGKIFVGDPHQQIYTFRGAVNALFTVPHTHVFYLTQVHTLCPHDAGHQGGQGVLGHDKSGLQPDHCPSSLTELQVWCGDSICGSYHPGRLQEGAEEDLGRRKPPE